MENYSAFEFIPMYFEFKAMTPNISQWNEKSPKANLPRYYRFLRLKSLLKAFGLAIDLCEFESGKFIYNKDISEYQFLTKELEKFNLSDSNKVESKEINNSDIQHVFIRFLQLLDSVHTVKSFNSGLMEASTVSTRFMYVTSKFFIEELYNLKHLMRIERILASIVDPENREFSIYELIDKYNFPDVDLFDIDINWM